MRDPRQKQAHAPDRQHAGTAIARQLSAILLMLASTGTTGWAASGQEAGDTPEQACPTTPIAAELDGLGDIRPPAPYEVRYRARSRGLSTSAYRQLRLDGDDYQLDQGLSLSVLGATLISVEEHSRFRWQSPRVVPFSYDYRQSGISSQRESIEFDWENGLARVDSEDSDPAELRLEQGGLDQLSFQVQLRIDVRAARQNAAAVNEFRYRVIDDDEIECHLYRIVGEERLQTDAGEFDTVKIERVREDSSRETLIWLIPEIDYLMARLIQRGGSDGRTELMLESLEQPPVERTP